MGKLDGKVAVITGGSTGIGLASAKRFVAEGAYVFITGRRQDELDKAAKQVGKNVTAVQGDISHLDDLDRLYETVRTEKGHFDILFANAGLGEFLPLDAITEEHFDRTFNVNVKGTLFTVQKALPLLNEGASIILTSSTSATIGGRAFSIYGASKAAVRNFARSWIQDLKGRNIRVNVLTPGPNDTPGLHGLVADESQSVQMMDRFKQVIPLGRVGHPDEVASAALFLASGESSFITGSELFVDGGLAQV